ncbi:MAG: dephospho-CoA kinase [Planctomycetota bacterium]
MNPQAIPTIGLLGGVASGKSAVAECFTRLGCVVLDGDQFGHRVLEQVAVQEAAVARWGPQVMNEGVIDRKQIALRVFGQEDANAAELQFWESITHPRIGALLAEEIARLRAAGGCGGIVLDAAVMMKAGWEKECDFLVFVDAPASLRLSRALQRGWKAEQFAARESSQISLAEKRAVSDFVIDNSGDLEQTYDQVVKVWHNLSS